MEPGSAPASESNGSPVVESGQGVDHETAPVQVASLPGAAENDGGVTPRTHHVVYPKRKSAGLDFPIVAKVTREERQRAAARALALGRGLAEHLRALIRQDLANADAGLPAPPAAPDARHPRVVAKRGGPVPTAATDRFWAKVDKRGEDECWEWTAFRSNANYGVFGSGHDGFGTNAAHRIAWMLANNAEVPDGMVMMHLCDNPPCCNPKHLRPGTYAENATDKAAKDRGRLGKAANITYAQAMSYREMILKGETTMMGVSLETGLHIDIVSRIFRGKTLTSDFKRLPEDALPRRLKRSEIRIAIETVLKAHGGLEFEELRECVKQILGRPPGKWSLVVYLKNMRRDGEVVFTGRRGGVRTGMRGGQRAITRYYLPGTVPDGVFIRHRPTKG